MGWKKRMSQAVREMEFAEYGSFFEDRPVVVDCALGTDPLGSPESVAEGLAQASRRDVGLCPGDDLPLRRLLTDYGGLSFSPEEVVLGTGSIGLLVAVARTFCAPGASVLGVSLSFPKAPCTFGFPAQPTGLFHWFLPTIGFICLA